ncbi:hypothetical protein M378DRAFT_174253 [Amanita muscaria Koide BX008]|uniref:Uncharacterized protein n=1 Tax=Amanita muscaria (strain Koide BX008) TaxID=946122 RepID=A0A0C2RW06_AMAMK|nr:hypothetical protein M378DRAFT_174253 [Amanita muscaria Koide BX008]
MYLPLTTDLSVLRGGAAPKVGKSGKQDWTLVFSVEIRDRVPRRGPNGWMVWKHKVEC